MRFAFIKSLQQSLFERFFFLFYDIYTNGFDFGHFKIRTCTRQTA